jgi:hypothetical protein
MEIRGQGTRDKVQGTRYKEEGIKRIKRIKRIKEQINYK